MVPQPVPVPEAAERAHPKRLQRRCRSVRRLVSTLLFVAGYWLMACLDAQIAFVPAVASFAGASALLVLPRVRPALET